MNCPTSIYNPRIGGDDGEQWEVIDLQPVANEAMNEAATPAAPSPVRVSERGGDDPDCCDCFYECLGEACETFFCFRGY